MYGLFQLVTALLLLSAASSSFQAGPGLLKALARQHGTVAATGILPALWGRTNRHHTPYWGVLLFLIVSGLVIAAAGGQDQRLVLFYAVSVFLSFLAGLIAMARFSARARRPDALIVNLVGAVAVAFTLVVNLARASPSPRWPPRCSSRPCSTHCGYAQADHAASATQPPRSSKAINPHQRHQRDSGWATFTR